MIMQKAAHLLRQNRAKFPQGHLKQLWGTYRTKSRPLQLLLYQVKTSLMSPLPRPFRPSNSEIYTITSDASDVGWGAVLHHRQKEIASTALSWTKPQAVRPIAHREAFASAKAVQNLLNLIPAGAILNIRTDAISTAYCWMKGSKNPAMNQHIIPTLGLLAHKKISPVPSHVPGQTNYRADWLSRNPDPKSYKLHPEIF